MSATLVRGKGLALPSEPKEDGGRRTIHRTADGSFRKRECGITSPFPVPSPRSLPALVLGHDPV